MINRIETDNVIELVENYFNEIISGSGFDYSWEVREGYKKDNTIYIKSYYHLMNENGYYVGNTPIEIKAKYYGGTQHIEIESIRYAKEKYGVYLGEYIEETIYYLTTENNNVTDNITIGW